ncbi:MAG: MotA/TolQ/ExbB proton channel family protein [Phycisphaerae bacterium]|nr:MotA/TolQ/ExbB proton channel family protein [Phycisphaerae bacterium]
MVRGNRRSLALVGALMVLFLTVLSTAVMAQEAPAGGQVVKVSIFKHYFIDGGWIVWFILLPMSMSVGAMGIMFSLRLRRVNLVPPEELQRVVDLLEARQYRQAIEETGKSKSLISYALHKSLSSASMGYLIMERALEDAIDEQAAHISAKIEPLNIIGNVGPLIGLFGTVVGMIETFTVIVGRGGVPNAQELAAGISIALVCTAWGLLVAIPGLVVFGLLRNRLDIFANEAAMRGQEVLNLFRGGMMNRPAGAPAAGAAPVAPVASAAPRVAPVAPQAGA